MTVSLTAKRSNHYAYLSYRKRREVAPWLRERSLFSETTKTNLLTAVYGVYVYEDLAPHLLSPSARNPHHVSMVPSNLFINPKHDWAVIDFDGVQLATVRDIGLSYYAERIETIFVGSSTWRSWIPEGRLRSLPYENVLNDLGATENVMSSAEANKVKEIVLHALGDPRWQFRTIGGIARETGLEPHDIRQVLESNPDLVRRPIVPDPEGRELYTLASKPPSRKERYARLRAFFTKSLE